MSPRTTFVYILSLALAVSEVASAFSPTGSSTGALVHNGAFNPHAFGRKLTAIHGGSSMAMSAAPAPVTPAAGFDKAVALGAAKAAQSWQKIATLGIVSGCHIGFGAYLALSVGGSVPGIAAENPGVQRILLGLFGLPMGLFMTLVGGGELFTGNTALCTAAVMEGKATVKDLSKNWIVSFLGNLVGSLLLAYLATVSNTLASTMGGPLATAVAKSTQPFAQAFVRGILCNWLVCMAVWCATNAADVGSKALAVLLPISGFVALGLDHSVANMFIIPFGMMNGADITIRQFLFGNLLPVTLGNIVGGAVCVAGMYTYAFGKKGQA